MQQFSKYNCDLKIYIEQVRRSLAYIDQQKQVSDDEIEKYYNAGVSALGAFHKIMYQ